MKDQLMIERIGVQYNKPFNLFASLMECPTHPEMIYCKDKDGAQLQLLQFYYQALLEVQRQYFLEHKKIDEMED